MIKNILLQLISILDREEVIKQLKAKITLLHNNIYDLKDSRENWKTKYMQMKVQRDYLASELNKSLTK